MKNNNERKKNKRKKSTRNSLKYVWGLLDEYCKLGSLHSLRYIRDASTPRIERFFWLGIFLTCLSISGIVVRQAYLTGTKKEFQLVLNPKTTPIWDIPFPAVMVCSAYPIRRSVFNLEKEMDNIKFRFFSKMVCSNKMAFDSEIFNNTIDEEFFDFISNAAIPCSDLIVNCYWNSKKKDCCTLFKPVITDIGLCYVFNSLPGEVIFRDYTPPPGVKTNFDDALMFWDIERGYPNRGGNRGKSVQPYWLELAGPITGLTFDLVDLREESQQFCSGPQSGFKMYIYPPDGNFEPETYIKVPQNAHSYIKLDPIVIHTEEGLRSVDPTERECLFNDESKLEYFNYYSQSACYVECFTKISIRTCGCAPFTSQRLVGIFSYPYCKESSNSCLLTVMDELIMISMNLGKNKTGISKECFCVPGCFWLSYDFQTSFHKVFNLNNLSPWKTDYYNNSYDIARLSIFYGVQQFNTIKRIIISDLVHNLSNCGGLLGLLLGFSFMSLFEVIYFAIVRPIRKTITLCFCVNRYKRFHLFTKTRCT